MTVYMREMVMESVAVTLYLIQGFVLARYCGEFARPRFGERITAKYCIVPVWMVLRELFNNLWHVEFRPVLTVVKQVMILVLLYACICCFYDTYRQMRIYLCVTYTAIGEICLFLILEINQLQQFVFQWCAWMFEQGKWDYTQTMQYMEVAAFALQMFSNILYLVIFRKLIRVVTEKFRYKNARLGNRELAYLLSPALMGWILGLLFRSMLYTLEDGVPYFLYEHYPVLHVFVPLILVTILGGIIVTILFYQEMAEESEKQLGMRILEQQLEGMQGQLREIERVNEANRSMRHDIKNILSVAMNLCDGISEENGGSLTGSLNKKTVLQRYLQDATDSLKESDLRFQTGDSAVDSILNMKFHEAAERVPGMVWNAEEFVLPGGLQIRSFDLCVILGNALDNAIEACEKFRDSGWEDHEDSDRLSVGGSFLTMCTKIRGQTILIEMKNPYKGELRQRSGAKYPDSLKENLIDHGIGMRNMQRVAEKYCGNMSFQGREGIFTLWITLQNRPPIDRI